MTKLPFDIGLSYIPIPPHQKAPIAKGWNLPETQITKASESKALDGMNVGLGLSDCTPVIVHIDFDDWPSASQYYDDLGIDIKKILIESGTAIFHSGRKYSLGALYSLPEPVGKPLTKVVKHEDIVSFEFRCSSKSGKTMCSVIPPSVHPSGTEYNWYQGDLTTITEMPERLLAHWLTLNDEKPKVKKHANDSALRFYLGHETPRKVAVLREQLTYINPDCDYPTWRDIIWAILSTGFPSAYSIARDWSEGAPHRYSYLHFLNTVDGYKSHLSRHTLGTIYYYAKIGGWNG